MLDKHSDTASKVFNILGDSGIPAEIIGGYAMSHYGYERYTKDVDIVVKRHAEVISILKEFGMTQGDKWFSLLDPETKIGIDILPSGVRLSANVVSNPTPERVSSEPVFTSLETLIRLKLGVVVCGRAQILAEQKNLSDVMHLMKANSTPRDFLGNLEDVQEDVNKALVVQEYIHIWDRVNAPGESEKLGEWIDPFEEFLQ